jgi:hypothetical protein
VVEGWSVIDRQTEFDPPKRSLHIMDFCQDTGVSVWWCFFFFVCGPETRTGTAGLDTVVGQCHPSPGRGPYRRGKNTRSHGDQTPLPVHNSFSELLVRNGAMMRAIRWSGWRRVDSRRRRHECATGTGRALMRMTYAQGHP